MIREVIKNTISKFDFNMAMVACVSMTAFAFSNFWVLTKKVPTENREIAIHMMGVIDTLVTMIVGYYFGATKRQTPETGDKIKSEQSKEKTA